MDPFCCDQLDDRDSASDASLTCHDDSILECDYDTQCTKLYKLIESKQWEEVLYYIDTGKFYDTSIFTSLFGKEPDPPSVQARTWVTALDESGDVRWCQLPLHAAVTFRAPHSVIEKLLQIYPKSVRCADDQDMLPLHYAFRFGAEDDVTALLIEKFPQAIGKRAVKDRLPLDMAQYSPKPERGIIIDYFIENAVRNAKTKWDSEYQKLMTGVKNQADTSLKHELVSSRKKLRETEKQLVEAREEMVTVRSGGARGERIVAADGRDDCVTPNRKSSNRKIKTSLSKYESVAETAGSSRATGDDHPYTITTEDKPIGSRLRGLFSKRKKQQQN
ncbi:hypothetical protein IV203_008327 [Nitzschia inconspicua]|uniref:Ankyrin repeat protein n=1 Tax=Nitzschia inconspicua TaxID=303405 RepID=A0A9K3KYB0_9STRA|nr:hypothetical protein IV203_008327 [Nitzschia inconspicua]